MEQRMLRVGDVIKSPLYHCHELVTAIDKVGSQYHYTTYWIEGIEGEVQVKMNNEDLKVGAYYVLYNMFDMQRRLAKRSKL